MEKPEHHQSPPSISLENKDKDPSGSFFELESIRRSAIDSEPFDAQSVVLVIMGNTELEDRNSDPEAYIDAFNLRFERALAKKYQFRVGNEERFRIEKNEKGENIRIPIPLDSLPDIDEFIMDAYDILEAHDSPLLGILDKVREERILVGDEYSVAMRLSILMATENLPVPEK